MLPGPSEAFEQTSVILAVSADVYAPGSDCSPCANMRTSLRLSNSAIPVGLMKVLCSQVSPESNGVFHNSRLISA